MKYIFMCLFSGLIFINCFAQKPSDCGASPHPITITQNSGSELTVIGKGSNLFPFTETLDGYTLIKNSDGNYCYAKLNNANELSSTNVIASEIINRTKEEHLTLSTLSKHLRTSSLTGKSYKQNIENLPEETTQGTFPTYGKRKILMILIQYPDLKAQYTTAEFQKMMNDPNYNGTGSLRDFYLDASVNKLDVTVDVAGWYTADSSYTKYGRQFGNSKSWDLIDNAIDSAEKDGVDFSKYDNDKDGKVDGVMIVHAGVGAEQGSLTQYIWSHRWNLDKKSRKYDGVTISDYIINPETRVYNKITYMTQIGVFCHEFGHMFGLPDYYDVNGKHNGIGEWGLMGSGNWLNYEKSPAGIDGYSRLKLKWATLIDIDQEGYYTLPPREDVANVYRVPTGVKGEYFLLENIQKKGYDKYMDGRGMIIWHVDSTVLAANWNSNTVDTNVKRKGLDVVEADGKDDLDKSKNRGDDGDLFPGSLKITNFNDLTYPSAKTYNGANSSIKIFGITQLADSSIKFGIGAAPVAGFNPSSSGVCLGNKISFFNTSKYANKFLWEFGDGTTDSLPGATHTYTKAGNYSVKLTAKSVTGLLDLDSQNITVYENADASFTASVNALLVSFFNTSTKTTGSYWNYGDGYSENRTDTSFTHKYKDTGTYNVKLIAQGLGGCNDTLIIKVHLFSTVSTLENLDPIRIVVIPNPTKDLLNVSPINIEGKGSFSMINTLGQTVLKRNDIKFTTNETFSIDLGPLPSGIYYLKIQLDNGQVNATRVYKQ